MRGTLFVVVALVLAGCVTPSVESVPVGPSAYVQGTRRGRDSYYVAKLDAALRKRPPTEREWVRAKPVAAGERRVVVRYESIDSAFPDRPRRAQAAVTASFVENVHYAPDGRDNGRSVTVWIKRTDTGERVSDEVVVLNEELPPLKPSEIPIRPTPTSTMPAGRVGPLLPPPTIPVNSVVVGSPAH